jgi:hypothetical protein
MLHPAWTGGGFLPASKVTMPSSRLYVGNLPLEMTARELTAIFRQIGPVRSAQVMLDACTGRSRGFGFVDMERPGDVLRALELTSGQEVDGRKLAVVVMSAEDPEQLQQQYKGGPLRTLLEPPARKLPARIS